MPHGIGLFLRGEWAKLHMEESVMSSVAKLRVQTISPQRSGQRLRVMTTGKGGDLDHISKVGS